MPTPTGTATGWSITTHLACLVLGALLTYLYVQLTKPRGGTEQDAGPQGQQAAPWLPHGIPVHTSPYVPPGTVLVMDPSTLRLALDGTTSLDPDAPAPYAIRLDDPPVPLTIARPAMRPQTHPARVSPTTTPPTA
jgi:hypothetical protein